MTSKFSRKIEGRPSVGKYLVTGTAGFIGSRVSERLLAAGHEVMGVDNLNDSYDVRMKEWRLGRLQEMSGFSFQRLDIADSSALRPVFESAPEAVLNLGARAGVRQSVEDPWAYMQANLTGTLNLLELCRDFGVGKFVQASTSSVYGDDSARPFAEESPANRPLTPYAASKKAAEGLIYTYHHLYGLDATVLRYFTVYGPAGRPDMVMFRFIRAIAEGETITVFGDGSQERDFTHVDDVARGTVAALRPLGYEIINLGGSQPAVLTDVISMIESALGKKARISYAARDSADVLATWADVGRAERLLGWLPQVPLPEGVRDAVDWYMANREWARDVR